MTPPTVTVTLPIPPCADDTRRSGLARGAAERDWHRQVAWHCMAENVTSRIGGPYALRLALHRMPIEPHAVLRMAVMGLRRAGVLPGNQRARVLTITADRAVGAAELRADAWMLAP